MSNVLLMGSCRDPRQKLSVIHEPTAKAGPWTFLNSCEATLTAAKLSKSKTAQGAGKENSRACAGEGNGRARIFCVGDPLSPAGPDSTKNAARAAAISDRTGMGQTLRFAPLV